MKCHFIQLMIWICSIIVYFIISIFLLGDGKTIICKYVMIRFRSNISKFIKRGVMS